MELLNAVPDRDTVQKCEDAGLLRAVIECKPGAVQELLKAGVDINTAEHYCYFVYLSGS